MAWKVVSDSAYGVWVVAHNPSLDAEAAMLTWLESLELADDPPEEHGTRRVGTEYLPWTYGPNGEQVIFKTAPHRILGIIDIRPNRLT